MHKVAAAEWIFSMVTARERAATTAGDLAEEACRRGALWFWWSVWRTACSLWWCDLSASPWETVRLAFWGLVADWVYSAVVAITTFLVLSVHPVRLGPNSTGIPPWGYSIIIAVTATAVPLCVGWLVARRSEGREVTAAFALVALFLAWFGMVAFLSAMQMRRIGRPFPGMEHEPLRTCLRSLAVVAGALLYRHSNLARRKPA